MHFRVIPAIHAKLHRQVARADRDASDQRHGDAAERQALLDRIQAPDATHIAAMEAIAPRQPAQTPEWVPVPLEGDLYIDDILDRTGAP